jgi:hypothetical protein
MHVSIFIYVFVLCVCVMDNKNRVVTVTGGISPEAIDAAKFL